MTVAFPNPGAVQNEVLVRACDLNSNGSIACPHALAGMTAWSAHPKVFLDVAQTGVATCPYCSTVYRLAPGEVVQSGH